MIIRQFTKKLTVLTLASLASFAQPAFGEIKTEMKKKYLQQHVELLKNLNEQKVQQQKVFQSLSLEIRKDLLSALSKIDNRVYEDLIEFQNQLKEKSKERQFADQFNDYILKHEDVIKRAYKSLENKRAYYESKYAKAIGKKSHKKNYKINPFYAVFGGAESSQAPPEEPTDLIFRAPFSEKEEHTFGAFIGSGNTSANKQSGRVSVSAGDVYDGGAIARAAMMESFEVPANISRVRVSAVLEYDFSIFIIAILGYGQGSVDSFIQAFNGSQMSCQDEVNIAWMIAPLIFWGQSSGSGLISVSCSFRPQTSGGSYLVSAGHSASSLGVIMAGSTVSNYGLVREIKVDLIR
jgi:hypothetical protein